MFAEVSLSSSDLNKSGKEIRLKVFDSKSNFFLSDYIYLIFRLLKLLSLLLCVA